LKSGEVQTDEELRTLIFPNGTSDANYRSFKSRLKKRLVNSFMLISIDADEVSNTDAVITFPINITIGFPLYMQVIQMMR
jgi:hypothetical protein